MKSIMMTAVVMVVLSAMAAAHDLETGAKSFKRKCIACHDVGPKAINKVGPLLNGLEGRKSGTIERYNYSDANKKSGIVWSDATFLDYIKDPKAKMPGTKMVFVGIKDEDEAKGLWLFLKQYGPDGQKK